MSNFWQKTGFSQHIRKDNLTQITQKLSTPGKNKVDFHDPRSTSYLNHVYLLL